MDPWIRFRSGGGTGSSAPADLDRVQLAERARGGHGFRAADDVQLVQDVVHVVLDRRQLDLKHDGDLLVREVAIDQTQHLTLSARERGAAVDWSLACERDHSAQK